MCVNFLQISLNMSDAILKSLRATYALSAPVSRLQILSCVQSHNVAATCCSTRSYNGDRRHYDSKSILLPSSLLFTKVTLDSKFSNTIQIKHPRELSSSSVNTRHYDSLLVNSRTLFTSSHDSNKGGADTRYYSSLLSVCLGVITGAIGKLFCDSFERNQSSDLRSATLISSVHAARGFGRTDDRENNNHDDDGSNSDGGRGGGKGKSPPAKHRAHYNFIADVVEGLAPSVVYIETIDLRR